MIITLYYLSSKSASDACEIRYKKGHPSLDMPLGFDTTLRDQFDSDRLLGVSQCSFKELHSPNLKGSEKKGPKFAGLLGMT
jgi:hypothetical protein